MSLEFELKRRGGIARTSTLIDRGFTQYALRTAFRAAKIVRPQRGWVALPDADHQLTFAAQHSVVLTCVTEAVRLGLWVSQANEMHVAGSLTARRTTAPGCCVHWSKPLVQRSPDLLTDHLENVLNLVADCQPHEAALAIWDSALQKNLTDYPALASLPLSRRARGLLAECTPFADSGLETIFRARLRWLRIPIRPQAWAYGHRVDFLIGARLVVQIDGRQHAGAQRVSDMAHDAELNRRGYHVIRVSYAQVMYEWEAVESAVLQSIARGQHLAPK